MPSAAYLMAGILIAAAVTWALRSIPFLMLARLEHSDLLVYLGQRMPVGIMVILAAYTLRDAQPGQMGSIAPLASGLVVTIGLHLWRRNPTLSIFAGTAASVIVASILS